MPACHKVLLLTAAAFCQSEAGVLRAAYSQWRSRSADKSQSKPHGEADELYEGGLTFLADTHDTKLGPGGMPLKEMPLPHKDELNRLVKATDLGHNLDMAPAPETHLDMVIYNPEPVYEDAWRVVYHSSRHRHRVQHHGGVTEFFRSAVFFEWCIFLAALPVFVALHYTLIDWPSTRWFHSVALLAWFGVAMGYLSIIWSRLGTNAGIQWFTGYVLEFIFSIENVFVFHIVVKAFKTPRRFTQKLLFIVICSQIVVEAVFYMGLADMLRRMLILPYILGVWLLYVGVEAAKDDHEGEVSIKDNSVYKYFEKVLGNRFRPQYEENGYILCKGQDGRVAVTLLGPVLASLLIVDFLLEVDVTLTKIEEIENQYIAFTSSVLAAFAVPELFFVARDLFQRFYLLKYGISFVLIFFGAQMLLHTVFEIPDLVGCAIIIGVMLVCMALSSYGNYGPGYAAPKAEEAEEIPLKEALSASIAAADLRIPPLGKAAPAAATYSVGSRSELRADLGGASPAVLRAREAHARRNPSPPREETNGPAPAASGSASVREAVCEAGRHTSE